MNLRIMALLSPKAWRQTIVARLSDEVISEEFLSLMGCCKLEFDSLLYGNVKEYYTRGLNCLGNPSRYQNLLTLQKCKVFLSQREHE